MEKDERVTIRFSKEEYSILKENVDKEGITLSNYIRNKVSCCNNLIQDVDTGQVNLQNIKKELIIMENYIEGLPQTKGDIKEYIKERIENIWLMLN